MKVDLDIIECFFGPAVPLVSKMLRPCFDAAPGHRLLVADFEQIEARVAMWLAHEQWVLDLFAKGVDVYRQTAAGILGKKPENVTKDQRQAYGKVSDLALQYGGGVGAYHSMAKNYGITVTDAVADRIKTDWRGLHPNTVATWKETEAAAFRVLRGPEGTREQVRRYWLEKIKFGMRLELPSGGFIYYPRACIRQAETTFPSGDKVIRDTIFWFGKHRQMKPTWNPTWGGDVFQSVTQAMARDVLKHAIIRAERAGYPVVLHVHDEIVCEKPHGRGSLDDLIQLMVSDLPRWLAGCPIAASGWEGPHYRK